MKFEEQGYQFVIWTEVSRYDGLAVVTDLPGQPVKEDPLQITNHVEVTPPLKNIEATISVGDTS